MPEYHDNTTLIFLTDHGRGSGPEDWKSHGQKIPDSKNIFIAIFGAGVEPHGIETNVPPVTQSQVAATVAQYLGLDWNQAEPQAGSPPGHRTLSSITRPSLERGHMLKSEHPHLQATLGTVQLWAIAVGLVISGEYFGWNFGWATAGTLGFLVTTIFVATMYTAFIFSFTELTVAIPNAGGPFSYAQRAFGPVGGYFASAATLVEFVFAPPAIALAIGSYLNVQFPSLSARTSAVGAYLLFMLAQHRRRADRGQLRTRRHRARHRRAPRLHGRRLAQRALEQLPRRQLGR